MATDLALPEISAQGLVASHDLSLVRQLRSSWNVRLKTSWSNNRLMDFEVSSGLSLEQCNEALAHLASANEQRAAPTQLAKALAMLTAVCAKPADFDDAKVVLWSERLKQVLGEYPGEIALAAVSQWPQSANGKWWPTEKEIRDECFACMDLRRRLKFELELQRDFVKSLDEPLPSIEDGFSDTPTEETARYVEAFRALDPVRAENYLAGARYRRNQIGIRFPLAKLTLDRAAPGLLRDYGVEIVTPRGYFPNGQIEWSR